MGLNSLLDGKKIWGFHEGMEADLDIAERKRIAEKLLIYGEQGINQILFYLNAYKTAEDYVVINEVNIAVTDEMMPAFMKLGEDYQFFFVEKEQIKKYIEGKDTIIFLRFKNNDIYGFDILPAYSGITHHKQRSEEIDELVERYLE